MFMCVRDLCVCSIRYVLLCVLGSVCMLYTLCTVMCVRECLFVLYVMYCYMCVRECLYVLYAMYCRCADASPYVNSNIRLTTCLVDTPQLNGKFFIE